MRSRSHAKLTKNMEICLVLSLPKASVSGALMSPEGNQARRGRGDDLVEGWTRPEVRGGLRTSVISSPKRPCSAEEPKLAMPESEPSGANSGDVGGSKVPGPDCARCTSEDHRAAGCPQNEDRHAFGGPTPAVNAKHGPFPGKSPWKCCRPPPSIEGDLRL